MPVRIEKIKRFSTIFAERSDIALGTELKKLSKPAKKAPEDVIKDFRYGEDDL